MNSLLRGRAIGWQSLFFVASLVTASFDIVLNLTIGGMSVRFTMIMQICFVLGNLLSLGFNRQVHSSQIIMPLSFQWLILWTIFLVLWTPQTYDLGFSIGYTMWLLLSVFFVFCAVQYFSDNPQQVWQMLRFYLNIYVLVAAFGLLQFVVGLAGYNLLVTQWWIEDRLPRLNGFSYEPSYYATYLITGWGMLAWMVERRVSLYSVRYTQIAFAIMSLALFLSSSRMAIIVVAAYAAYYFLKNLFKIFFTFKIDVRYLKVVVACVIVSLLILSAVVLTTGFGSLKFLLFGTGIAGTADHSTSNRVGQFQETLNLFRESPIVGYGLGGVWSYIAARHSLPVGDVTGMNITAEVLAATGLLGFPFFVIFIYVLITKSFSFLRRNDIHAELLAASGLGFILLFLILQFNQSILRVYFWNHIAIMAVLYHHVSRTRTVTGGARRLVRGAALARGVA